MKYWGLIESLQWKLEEKEQWQTAEACNAPELVLATLLSWCPPKQRYIMAKRWERRSWETCLDHALWNFSTLSEKMEVLCFGFFFFNILFCIGLQPVQCCVRFKWTAEGLSHTYIHVAILPQPSLPSTLPHNIEQSSLCYTEGPCCLSILIFTYKYKNSCHCHLFRCGHRKSTTAPSAKKL